MPTRVTIRAAGLLLLAASLSCGGGDAPATHRTRFAYVVNNLDKSLSGYSVNPTTGALTPLTPAPTAGSGVGPAVVVRNRFLYLNGTSSVIAYTVDSATGTFTWVGDYSLSSANFQGMAASADGQYLFVAGATSISAFQIGVTGALTAVAGSPFSTSTYAPLRLSSAGPFVLAGGASAVLTLPSAAGVLAAPQVRSTASTVWDFVGSADGRHAYAADSAGRVTAYTVDLASGAMTAMVGTHNADAATPVFGAVVHPGGKFLYVVNHGGTVTRFDISASDGSLGPTSVVTARGVTEAFEHVFTDPEGRFLYLTNNAVAPHNYVIGFTIDLATGALTPMASTFPTSGDAQGMVFVTE